ncbi:large ribosomal subunit protein mL45 [Bacillus rossius redtenbacheri]|uniref:large ribosomal subunit protein mL45 n=1 Tax=Bacillus rossius redtenbacheri TaxID=93214 RepID=UPI002FDD602A
MAGVTFTGIKSAFKVLQVLPALGLQPVRHINKHWNPKFKRLRKLKVVKVELPDFDELPEEDMTQEQVRSKMKERGIQPVRPWTERPVYISSTGGVFEPYVPPEGDGKMSPITTSGAKQKFELLEKKSKSMLAVRKIRSFDEDFETRDFVVAAHDIYVKAHELLASKEEDKLHEFVTERAFPEMLHNIKDKTIHWKFVQSLEPARVVHARCTDVVSKENVFAQLTVRFHTQQVLAVYDRFGRLMQGSELVAKDVLEYVVFEKHLANQYGLWRIHEKIIPDWLPAAQASPRTVCMSTG